MGVVGDDVVLHFGSERPIQNKLTVDDKLLAVKFAEQLSTDFIEV
jgi:hypothetical protein